MTITFDCESCHSEFTVDSALAGRKGRCKNCGHRLVIPEASPAPEEAAASGEPILAGPRRSISSNSGAKANQRSAGQRDEIWNMLYQGTTDIARQVASKYKIKLKLPN